MSNVVTQLARIIQKKVIRTINNVPTNNGSIRIGGPNLLEGTTSTEQTKEASDWGTFCGSTNGSSFVPLPNVDSYVYGVNLSSTVTVHCAVHFFDENNNILGELQGNSIPAGQSGLSWVRVDMSQVRALKASHIVFYTNAFVTETEDTHSVTWSQERLFEGDVLFPYMDDPVTSVGGQKPVHGAINMEGYALNTDLDALKDRIAKLEAK